MSRYDIEINHHGGSCCGISHIYNYPTGCDISGCDCDKSIDEAVLEKELRAAMLEAIKLNKAKWRMCYYNVDEDDLPKRRHAIEVVLTSQQVEKVGGVLDRIGFKEVYSFANSNSNNTCHVFFCTTGDIEIGDKK